MDIPIFLTPFVGFGSDSWHGRVVSHDGASTDLPTEDDVVEIIGCGESEPSDWDGDAAGVVRLKDGRYMAWETNWGPTGNGFSEDAYGGNAEVHFGLLLTSIVNMALTDEGRKLAGLTEMAEPPSNEEMAAARTRLQRVERSLNRNT